MELDEYEVDSHTSSAGHLVSLAAMLRNRTECDTILRRLRPSEFEKDLLQKCKAELQRVLKPAAIWWTGSVGKGTSLSGSHDVDVCLNLGGSHADAEEALLEIVSRLQHSDEIKVKRVEKKLVFAVFRTCIGGDSFALELDILPDFGFGRAQVRHQEVFSKMDAAQKDAVRFLKAWSRLSLKTPGILLETVVHQCVLSASVTSHVQGYVIEALRALSSRRYWQDPTDRSIDLGRSLELESWEKLQGLAKTFLALREVQLEPSESCKQSYPCIHGMSLIDDQGRRHDLGEQCGFDIVEMHTRLGVRLPSHFIDYPKVKDPSLRQEACENNYWSFWGDEFFVNALRKRSIQLGDNYLSLVKEVGHENHPRVLAIVHDFESLMTECSQHPSTKVQEQGSVLAMLFSCGVEHAKGHMEAAAAEEAERRARVVAEERLARQHALRVAQHALVHGEHHGDVQNSNPCEAFVLLMLVFAFFIKWLESH